MTWQSLIWVAQGAAMLLLAAAAVVIKYWLSTSQAHICDRDEELKIGKSQLQARIASHEAAVQQAKAQLAQEQQHCAELQASVDSQRSGLEFIQSMLADVFADGEPCGELLAEGALTVAASEQGSKPILAERDNPVSVAVESTNGFLDLRLHTDVAKLDRPAYLVLRHRDTGYLRLGVHQLLNPPLRQRLTRLDFQSIVERRQFGSWDAILLCRGRVADRVTVDLQPTELLFVSQLAVVCSRVGMVMRRDNSVAQLEKQGQSVTASDTRAMYPFLRIQAPWPHPYRVRVMLEGEQAEPLVREHQAEGQSTLLEWLSEFPIEASTMKPGNYCIRWQAAPLDGDAVWRELATWEFRLKRPSAALDWLDGEGELKRDYVTKIAAHRVTAREIMAGLNV